MNKLIISLFLGFALPWSFAGTMKGNEETCRSFSQFVYSATELRDQGILWEQFEPWLDSAIREALANPSYSYVRDQEDADFVRKILANVWTSLEQSAMDLAAAASIDCMSK